MKLLLIIVIAYLVYRTAKSRLMRNPSAPPWDSASNPKIDDVMIKDPVCGTYFPRREGVELRHAGQVIVFCSATCRDRFLEQQK